MRINVSKLICHYSRSCYAVVVIVVGDRGWHGSDPAPKATVFTGRRPVAWASGFRGQLAFEFVHGPFEEGNLKYLNVVKINMWKCHQKRRSFSPLGLSSKLLWTPNLKVQNTKYTILNRACNFRYTCFFQIKDKKSFIYKNYCVVWWSPLSFVVSY